MVVRRCYKRINWFGKYGPFGEGGTGKAVMDGLKNMGSSIASAIGSKEDGGGNDSKDVKNNPAIRDQNLLFIKKHVRMAWQKKVGYNNRSKVENTFFRYKTIL